MPFVKLTFTYRELKAIQQLVADMEDDVSPDEEAAGKKAGQILEIMERAKQKKQMAVVTRTCGDPYCNDTRHLRMSYMNDDGQIVVPGVRQVCSNRLTGGVR